MIKTRQAYQYQHAGAWITAFPVDVDGILVTNPLAGEPGTLVYLFDDKRSGVHHWKTAAECQPYPVTPIEQPSDKVEVKA